MLKLALATVLAGAAGTTLYVAQRDPAPRPAAPHVAPVAPASTAPIVRPAPTLHDVPDRAAAPLAPSVVAPKTRAEAAALEVAHNESMHAPLDRALADRLQLFDGPSRGRADAPLSIVVFTDLACQFCGKALGTLDELLDEHPDDLRIVVKQFPVKPGSDLSAKAVLAADAQGKFWPMHDLLFANQDAQTPADLEHYATEIGLDLAVFRAALSSTAAAGVERDRAGGLELGVQGTPTFIIGDQLIRGAMPVSVLRAKIEAALPERPSPARP